MLLSEQYRHISVCESGLCYCIFLHLPFLTRTGSGPTEAALSISFIVVLVRDGGELQLNHSTADDILPESVALSTCTDIPVEPQLQSCGLFPQSKIPCDRRGAFHVCHRHGPCFESCDCPCFPAQGACSALPVVDLLPF